MIYTCYEMIQDCRADKPEGWRYFISSYVPVIRKLVAHYDPALADGAEATGFLERVLVAQRQPGSNLFQSLDPAPERWFVAQLRQKVVAELPLREPEIEIGLDTVDAAFSPLTLTEKVAAWTETMRYDAEQTGAMLRMSPETVARIREHSAELVRGQADRWRSTVLVENGLALGLAAAAAAGKDCLPAKVFLDVLDGRATWRGREQMESHTARCLHCIDHFARMAEVIEVLRGVTALNEADAAPWCELLGVQKPRPPLWKRLAGNV
jgi:hypothetical protein